MHLYHDLIVFNCQGKCVKFEVAKVITDKLENQCFSFFTMCQTRPDIHTKNFQKKEGKAKRCNFLF